MKRLLMGGVCCAMLLASNTVKGSNLSVEETPEVGTLTAYYATENFTMNETDFQKGMLVCDTNDPFNRIVTTADGNYKYEGDDACETGYSYPIQKGKLEKKTFTMNELTTDVVGKNIVFKAANGKKARIFLSTINGHKYYNFDGEEENKEATEEMKECYVVSIEMGSPEEGETYFFEEQLDVINDCLVLYGENPYDTGNQSADNLRYREGAIGLVVEKWNNKSDWDYTKSAFSEDGKLLTDQWEIVDIPDMISIAYIGDQDALYVNGDLYFRVK